MIEEMAQGSGIGFDVCLRYSVIVKRMKELVYLKGDSEMSKPNNFL